MISYKGKEFSSFTLIHLALISFIYSTGKSASSFCKVNIVKGYGAKQAARPIERHRDDRREADSCRGFVFKIINLESVYWSGIKQRMLKRQRQGKVSHIYRKR